MYPFKQLQLKIQSVTCHKILTANQITIGKNSVMAIIANFMSQVSTNQNYFISLFTLKSKTARFQLRVCNICHIFYKPRNGIVHKQIIAFARRKQITAKSFGFNPPQEWLTVYFPSSVIYGPGSALNTRIICAVGIVIISYLEGLFRATTFQTNTSDTCHQGVIPNLYLSKHR